MRSHSRLKSACLISVASQGSFTSLSCWNPSNWNCSVFNCPVPGFTKETEDQIPAVMLTTSYSWYLDTEISISNTSNLSLALGLPVFVDLGLNQKDSLIEQKKEIPKNESQVGGQVVSCPNALLLQMRTSSSDLHQRGHRIRPPCLSRRLSVWEMDKEQNGRMAHECLHVATVTTHFGGVFCLRALQPTVSIFSSQKYDILFYTEKFPRSSGTETSPLLIFSIILIIS